MWSVCRAAARSWSGERSGSLGAVGSGAEGCALLSIMREGWIAGAAKQARRGSRCADVRTGAGGARGFVVGGRGLCARGKREGGRVRGWGEVMRVQGTASPATPLGEEGMRD
jgi:hypothetical protein